MHVASKVEVGLRFSEVLHVEFMEVLLEEVFRESKDILVVLVFQHIKDLRGNRE